MPPTPPETTRVTCGTTVKDSDPVVMEFHHNWSPVGVEHVLSLFREGFYNNIPLFRVIKGFLVQFGLTYDKDLQRRIGDTRIMDDPQLIPPIRFRPGIISYAGSGPNSRTGQIFVSYGSAASLGTMPWETPLGEVTSGMETMKALYHLYGDKPQQGKIRSEGKAYIDREFPLLHHTTTCTIIEEETRKEGGPSAADFATKNVAVTKSESITKGDMKGGIGSAKFTSETTTTANGKSFGNSFIVFSAVVAAFACFLMLRKMMRTRRSTHGGRKST